MFEKLGAPSRRIPAAVLSLVAFVFPPARAAEPGTGPNLRIETGRHAALISEIAVDRTGKLLVTASEDKTLRLWELPSGALLDVLRPPIGKGKEGMLYAVALSPDGETIATGGWTGEEWDGSCSVYLFSRSTRELVGRLTGLPGRTHHLAFSPDGRYLVACLGKAYGIRLYDTSYREQVGEDAAYGEECLGADFSPSGRLVTTSWDGFVRLYDVGDGGLTLLTRRRMEGGPKPLAVAFSPDGARIAVGFAGGTPPAVLSGADLSHLFSPDTTGVERGSLTIVAWSADGRTLYAGGSWARYGSHPIRAWTEGDVTDWRNDPSPMLFDEPLPLKPNETSRSLAIAPDRSRFLLGASWTLYLFDATGRELWRRTAPGTVWGVNIAANGLVAVAAYGDGTIRWHRMSDGAELLALFPHVDGKRWVLFTPSGTCDAAPGAEDLIGWHVNRAKAEAAELFHVSRFRDGYFRPDSIDRVLGLINGSEGRTAARPDLLDEAPGVPARVRRRP